jgi:hypothetical protein
MNTDPVLRDRVDPASRRANPGLHHEDQDRGDDDPDIVQARGNRLDGRAFLGNGHPGRDQSKDE